MADNLGLLHEPGMAYVSITAADAATAHRIADVIASRYPDTRPPRVRTTPEGLVEFDLYTDTLNIAPQHARHARDL